VRSGPATVAAMRIVVFGASGMIGQAVVREALHDPDIVEIVSVVRRAGDVTDPKLREIVHADFADFTAIADRLAAADACLFCLGVSSAGMTEPAYRHITYDVTLAAAKVLARPTLTFVYITGVGTDGKAMWARVKKATEDALLALPFKAAYMIRPGYIQPRHGVKSRTPWTRRLYSALGWMYPLVRVLTKHAIGSDELARAMLRVAKQGAPDKVLYSRDLRAMLA